MTSSNRNAPKGCIHSSNLAKHLHTFHDCKRSLEDIQQQIKAVILDHPPHEGSHTHVPFFPDGILPPAVPGV
ncbi:hypothetical protein PJP10_31525, partial [Mycobacterium kansasii]